DLKTPLNIIVLNVELLKMRLRGMSPEIAEDPKIDEHCRALERESTRISVLADAFLSVAQPPEEDEPERIEALALFREALENLGFRLPELSQHQLEVTTFRSRLEKCVKLVGEGIASEIAPAESVVEISIAEGVLFISVEGPCRDADRGVDSLFKFYSVDTTGEPRPILATARLLLETIGGSFTVEAGDEGIARFLIRLQGDQ
ncbi:MAG: hypothetical protein R3338_08710, partial [Thermoanaerobaculia bacterium]|nr:hypothetical protein [Thermoanaerobaculia bacterium]